MLGNPPKQTHYTARNTTGRGEHPKEPTEKQEGSRIAEHRVERGSLLCISQEAKRISGGVSSRTRGPTSPGLLCKSSAGPVAQRAAWGQTLAEAKPQVGLVAKGGQHLFPPEERLGGHWEALRGEGGEGKGTDMECSTAGKFRLDWDH